MTRELAERNSAIIASRMAGETFREIGKRYGVCGQRARDIFFRHKIQTEIAEIKATLLGRLVGVSMASSLSRFFGIPCWALTESHLHQAVERKQELYLYHSWGQDDVAKLKRISERILHERECAARCSSQVEQPHA